MKFQTFDPAMDQTHPGLFLRSWKLIPQFLTTRPTIWEPVYTIYTALNNWRSRSTCFMRPQRGSRPQNGIKV